MHEISTINPSKMQISGRRESKIPKGSHPSLMDGPVPNDIDVDVLLIETQFSRLEVADADERLIRENYFADQINVNGHELQGGMDRRFP